jgi:hypothetical protein
VSEWVGGWVSKRVSDWVCDSVNEWVSGRVNGGEERSPTPVAQSKWGRVGPLRVSAVVLVSSLGSQRPPQLGCNTRAPMAAMFNATSTAHCASFNTPTIRATGITKLTPAGGECVRTTTRKMAVAVCCLQWVRAFSVCGWVNVRWCGVAGAHGAHLMIGSIHSLRPPRRSRCHRPKTWQAALSCHCPKSPTSGEVGLSVPPKVAKS